MSQLDPLACLAAASLLLLAACARPEAWRHRIALDHPLTGRIWDVGAQRFITEASLAERLAAADFVMLGEKHDNADHHRLQAKLLRAMTEAGRRPTVGFEMLTSAEAPALDRYLVERPRDAAGLGEAVDWEGRGWPDWDDYQPIARVALDYGLAIAAAGLPRAVVRRLGAEGMAAIGAARMSRLGLDEPLDRATEAAMTEEMRLAHCGELPESLLPRMVQVQRARDAVMADNLVSAAADAGTGGGALIAGAGHARKDRGVPAFIARLRPGASQASLAFLEVDAGRREPSAYAELYGAERLPFDVVWFTPRVDEDDPCEKLRKEQQQVNETS